MASCVSGASCSYFHASTALHFTNWRDLQRFSHSPERQAALGFPSRLTLCTTPCLSEGKASCSLAFIVVWEVSNLSKILLPMSDSLKCTTLASKWYKHHFTKDEENWDSERIWLSQDHRATDRTKVSHKLKLTFWGVFWFSFFFLSFIYFYFIDVYLMKLSYI